MIELAAIAALLTAVAQLLRAVLACARFIYELGKDAGAVSAERQRRTP